MIVLWGIISPEQLLSFEEPKHTCTGKESVEDRESDYSTNVRNAKHGEDKNASRETCDNEAVD